MKNEARAVEKLYAKGSHPNLVTVLDHGFFTTSLYYVDMELCDMTLGEYISGINPPLFFSNNPRLLGISFTNRGIWCIWDIMEQISNGLQFIHSCNEIHRDIKPTNSEHCNEIN